MKTLEDLVKEYYPTMKLNDADRLRIHQTIQEWIAEVIEEIKRQRMGPYFEDLEE